MISDQRSSTVSRCSGSPNSRRVAGSFFSLALTPVLLQVLTGCKLARAKVLKEQKPTPSFRRPDVPLSEARILFDSTVATGLRAYMILEARRKSSKAARCRFVVVIISVRNLDGLPWYYEYVLLLRRWLCAFMSVCEHKAVAIGLKEEACCLENEKQGGNGQFGNLAK